MPGDLTEAEREKLKAEWPAEYADGERMGKERFTSYPRGLLYEWSEDRKDAWWAGYNVSWAERAKGLKGAPTR